MTLAFAASTGEPAGVSFPALGTSASLLVAAAQALKRGRSLLEDELTAIDLACSRFRADSELARLNRAQGRPMRISALFAEALDVALQAARDTDGDTVGAERAVKDTNGTQRAAPPVTALYRDWRAEPRRASLQHSAPIAKPCLRSR
jgi:hypothetical protein